MVSLQDIPVVSTIVNMVPHVDYEGQKLGERLFQYILILFGVVGFAWGYICQQFSQTVYVLGAGFVLACLLVLPPWPFYRRHPLPWISCEDKGGKKKKAEDSRSSKTETKKKK